MNLSRKTLLYSSIISIIIVTLIIGYFMLMLPSLYVAYMEDSNYDSIVRLHEGYMKTGSYEDLAVKNPTGSITVELPFSEDSFYIINKFFKLTVLVENQKLRDVLDQLKYYANHYEELEDINIEDFDPTELIHELLGSQEISDIPPLKFEFELYENDNVFEEISSKFHIINQDTVVMESNITDGNNYYTSYIAMGKTKRAISITLLSVMTPRIDEIRPVIFQSLPMIIAIALLLVMVSSQVFSKLIIQPIIKLANHAEYMKETKNLRLEPLIINGHDEISSLGESLNGLYQKVKESYQELEVKNQYLAEENKRQEIFLRASSHQLKTPITAALLLVQGMISEVGKYKDVKTYLPQVKQQIQSMQKIVEDILHLNHCSQNLQIEPLNLLELLEDCLSAYQIQIGEKALSITIEGTTSVIDTDREVLSKIIDNLLSNAIHFTSEGGDIRISVQDNKLSITNYGVNIEEELLPHVFEPFVTSVKEMKQTLNFGERSHGLGLYVVSYYAKLLHCQVKLYNIKNAVRVDLLFTKNLHQ
jgi:signal transduction histidine kinase